MRKIVSVVPLIHSLLLKWLQDVSFLGGVFHLLLVILKTRSSNMEPDVNKKGANELVDSNLYDELKLFHSDVLRKLPVKNGHCRVEIRVGTSNLMNVFI